MLSSGTWEILMVRSAQVDTSLLCDYSGSTCELDSQPGRYNPGMAVLRRARVGAQTAVER